MSLESTYLALKKKVHNLSKLGGGGPGGGNLDKIQKNSNFFRETVTIEVDLCFVHINLLTKPNCPWEIQASKCK